MRYKIVKLEIINPQFILLLQALHEERECFTSQKWQSVLEGEPTLSNSGTMPAQYNGNSWTEDNGVKRDAKYHAAVDTNYFDQFHSKNSSKNKAEARTSAWWTLLPIPHWNLLVKEGESSNNTGNCSKLVSRLQSSGKQQQQEHLHWQVATPAAMEPTLKAGSYIPILIKVLKKKKKKSNTIPESLQLCKIPPCRVEYI